ncbi:MAG: ribonuclease P protein component [Candidatus Syntrophonatronum acetioxidans]|uniref:Ribonuclease P protein component n=1 Tax=Candidatus Syntrophonatronum acetioxidans TaxID=1795816 RepID=A0A424YB07_9FIRM|nr:MAG: ribonuclease P protein component [Candidatus Syntrophonatronum acetioxidans]
MKKGLNKKTGGIIIPLEKIKKNREYRDVYKKGKKFVSSFTVLYVMPNEREKTRVGITVSKKIGNSVTRNRVKRIYREVCRLKEKDMKNGYDLVIVARKKAKELDFWKGWKDLNKLFYKSKIIFR